MKLKTPIKTVHDNLMLTKSGDIYAYYRISPSVIPTSNNERLEDHKHNHSLLFEELAKYKDIHIEMYPKQMNLDKRFDVLEKDFHPSTFHVGKYYNQETINLLNDELGTVTENDFILGVRLKSNLLDGSEDVRGVVKNAFASVTDSLVNWFGLEREVTEEFFNRFKTLENELFEHVQAVGGVKLTDDELIYVNRFNFLRNIDHAVEEEKKKRGVSNITDSIIDPTEPGYLKLLTTEGQCYMSFVVVDDFSSDMEYSHLFQRAQSLPFPVEVHIKAKYQEKEAALRRIGFAKQRFKEQDKDMAESGEAEDDDMLEFGSRLHSLQSQLKSNSVEYMKWVATFVVYGETKEECKYRANTTKRVMRDSGIDCVRPIADQLQLFYKFLHGASMQFEKNWVQESTNKAFSENLFAVSNKLGTKIGFYFGRVDKSTEKVGLEQSIASSRDVMLFHPFIANEGIAGAETDSPHISITGQTGKGKSFLVKLILIYLSFLDCKILMTDPKTEIQYWFEKVAKDPNIRKDYKWFAELIESFHYTTLNADDPKNWGVLDPICFLKGAEAKDTAQSAIEQVYNMDGKDDIKTEVLKSLTQVIEQRERGEKVGMMNVIYNLQKSDSKNIRSAGDLLFQMVENSVLRLVFSDGLTEGIRIDGKVNILQIEGLDLPKEDDDPHYYTDSERKSLCMMIPLAKYCEKFGSEDKSENTAVIFDEAWMLTNARGGKKLVKSMRRVGRSYKNQLYLVTQSVSDVSTDNDKGNFGARFAFDESEERDDILTYMGLSKTDGNRDLLANMVKGQCLFRDFYGRVGKMSIDCLFDEWKEAFKTVEKSHSARAEEEIM
ncbi:ATP-binding protein [Shouchella miscanthi]|uniref:ATP-binding protein n=1 Tax=Shouchella miscanthi TaxID=2598861 RepID=A0ABU6NJ19_9BACI|nr:ATP-binding protein [Shouchella miscanthi]